MKKKTEFLKALIVSNFSTDWSIFSTKGSFRGGTEVFGGHFQVIYGAVGSRFSEIGFGSGILLHEVSEVSLSILRWHTSQPLDQCLVLQIDISLCLFIVRIIEWIFDKSLFWLAYRRNCYHLLHQNVVLAFDLWLAFSTYFQKLHSFMSLALGLVKRKLKFFGDELSIEVLIFLSARRCFRWASCLRFLSKSRLDVIIFHINLLYLFCFSHFIRFMFNLKSLKYPHTDRCAYSLKIMPNWHEPKDIFVLIFIFIEKIKDPIHVQTYMIPKYPLANLYFHDFSNNQKLIISKANRWLRKITVNDIKMTNQNDKSYQSVLFLYK